MLDSPVQEIKERLDIVDVIQQYIRLQKAGANYKALCPFHSEKTPSFMVSPSKQIWHCFGACNEGGDIFSFVMKIEGIEFVDALRTLANKAGVVLKKQDPKLKNEKTRLYEISELATKFFQKQLAESNPGKKVKAYLKDRGISEKSIEEFRIGYAPNSWHALGSFLQSRRYRGEEIERTGLIIKKLPTGNYYDRFRGRIMFPIMDFNGSVIAFSGRIFGEEEGVAKYVNSPETLIYNKSKVLYGLDKARIEIRKRDLCILVEGQMDLIASHQAGVRNVVASSGTALTLEHIKIIKRYTENLCTSFDMDEAGSVATKRGIDLAQKEGLNVRVISLPQAKDPADYITSLDRESIGDWDKLIKQAKSIMEFYFENAFSRFDASKVEGKREIAKILLPSIKRIPNKIEQAFWIQELAHRLSVEEKVLAEALEGVKVPTLTNAPKEPLPRQSKTREESLEEQLLGLLLAYPQYRKLVLEAGNLFSIPKFAEIFREFKKECETSQKLLIKDFQKKLSPQLASQIDYLTFKVEQSLGEKDPRSVAQEIKLCVKELKDHKIRSELRDLSLRIRGFEREGKDTDVLVERFNRLSRELASLSGRVE